MTGVLGARRLDIQKGTVRTWRKRLLGRNLAVLLRGIRKNPTPEVRALMEKEPRKDPHNFLLKWTLPLDDKGEPLKKDLGERCEQTSSWSIWAPALKQLLRLSLLSLLKEHGFDDGSGCSLRKMLNREQWFRHFQQLHRPFRRDCRTCLLHTGSGKPHRRKDSGGSSSWSTGGWCGSVSKKVARAMVGTLLAPVFDVHDGKMNVGSAELWSSWRPP